MVLKSVGDSGSTPTPNNNQPPKSKLAGDVEQYGSDTQRLNAATGNGEYMHGGVNQLVKKVNHDAAQIKSDLDTPQGQQALEAYNQFQKDSQGPSIFGIFNHGRNQSAMNAAGDAAHFYLASGGANLQYFTEYMNANGGNSTQREMHIVDKSGKDHSIGEESIKSHITDG